MQAGMAKISPAKPYSTALERTANKMRKLLSSTLRAPAAKTPNDYGKNQLQNALSMLQEEIIKNKDLHSKLLTQTERADRLSTLPKGACAECSNKTKTITDLQDCVQNLTEELEALQ
jgi:hypothetical protein